jgi:hypothetical protein
LGNYHVSSDEGRTPASCPISKELTGKILALPIIMILAVSMCMINLFIPAASFREQLTYIFFWGATSIATIIMLLFWGPKFVDAPKLYLKFKQE